MLADITLLHLLAVALMGVAWYGYSPFLRIFGKVRVQSDAFLSSQLSGFSHKVATDREW